MKKIFGSLAIIAMLAGAVSCQKTIEAENPQPGKSGIVIKASIDPDETKVVYERSEVGGKARWQPKWEVNDIVVGIVDGNPAKFKVKETADEGKEAVLEYVEGQDVTAGSAVRLMYAPGITELSSVADGKVVVNIGGISSSLDDINVVMTAQGTATEEALSLKFRNKMAIVAINSITGLAGTAASKITVVGTELYSSAVVDLAAGTVSGKNRGDLVCTEGLTVSGGEITTPVYAALVPATTTIEVYTTTTDGGVYYSAIASKTLAAKKFYTTNRDCASAPVFTIDAAGTKAIFAPGNLQGNLYDFTATGMNWRFASDQTVTIGANSGNIKNDSKIVEPDNTLYIDLFAWSADQDKYRWGWSVREPSTTLGAAYAEDLDVYDWGNASISGYAPNYWRLPSSEEWDYVVNTRSGNRYAYATVGGKTGVVVFPDNSSSVTGWEHVNEAGDYYATNERTLAEIGNYLFLPNTGIRQRYTDYEAKIAGETNNACYWQSGKAYKTIVDSSTVPAKEGYTAPVMAFSLDGAKTGHRGYSCEGNAVRLIHIL